MSPCRSGERSAFQVSRREVRFWFFFSFASVFFSPPPKVWLRERQEPGAARDRGRRPGQAPRVRAVNNGECPGSGARRRRGLRSGAALLSPPRAGEAGSPGCAGGSPACARPALPRPRAWTAALGRRPPRRPPEESLKHHLLHLKQNPLLLLRLITQSQPTSSWNRKRM